ncbi:MAG: hypothetical protein DWQ35_04005 [Planctomycetota bacterium]|nr:MAG: hypothetical protein DWQ35_04005 [Planctomycetota bacterium]
MFIGFQRAHAFLRTCLGGLLVAVLVCGAVVAEDRESKFERPKRSVRSRQIDQQHIKLTLSLDWEKRELTGQAEITLRPFASTRSIQLDAAEMEIQAVRRLTSAADGDPRELRFETREDRLLVHFEKDLVADAAVTLQIDYRTKPQDGLYFLGPTEVDPDRPRIAWTQGEAEYARHWFPCFDSPTDRLTSEVIATVPAEFFVLSNGTLQSKTKGDDGTQTWHWRQRREHVSYLIALVAGEFEAYRQEWDGIPIVSYVPKGRLADAPWSYRKTPDMIRFFSERLDYRYPWAKYAQISVEDFMFSGMENTSATTINLSFLHDERAYLDRNSEGLVAHEVAHQWFGNLLTCKDWGELWLNEGFAVYFTQLWVEHEKGWDESAWQIYNDELGYQGLDRRIRRPIVTYRYEKPFDMFDGHSYAKAGRVLHMLRHVLGDELFWKAMRHYVRKHANSSVETADLRIAIEESTGRSLNWFFDQWLHHAGYPEYQVEYAWNDDSQSVAVTIRQTQKVGGRTPLFRMPVELELVTSQDTQRHRVTVSQAEETFHFQLDERPRRVNFDPRNWILKTLDFAKSKQELIDGLRNEPHMLCRVRSAKGLGKLKEDEEATASLADVARRDAFYGVRQEAVNQLHGREGDLVRRTLLDLAQQDPHAHVRRAAINGLGDFKDDETRGVLRSIVADDPSYYAIADALRTLAKVDEENCAADLIAALSQRSDKEVILRAAAESLADLEHPEGCQAVMKIFAETGDVDQRAAVMNAVAKIGKARDELDDTVEKLAEHLNHPLQRVRRAAARALGKTGQASALGKLRSRLDEERRFAVKRDIRSAIDELSESAKDSQELSKKVEQLREQMEKLQEQLKRLDSEAAAESSP